MLSNHLQFKSKKCWLCPYCFLWAFTHKLSPSKPFFTTPPSHCNRASLPAGINKTWGFFGFNQITQCIQFKRKQALYKSSGVLAASSSHQCSQKALRNSCGHTELRTDHKHQEQNCWCWHASHRSDSKIHPFHVRPSRASHVISGQGGSGEAVPAWCNCWRRATQAHDVFALGVGGHVSTRKIWMYPTRAPGSKKHLRKSLILAELIQKLHHLLNSADSTANLCS